MSDKEQDIMEKMNAFYYFKQDGIESVKRIFPDQLEFIQANKNKTYDQVKKELLQELPKAQS